MTFAPATLLELRAYLQPKTGLSAASLGIVGDAAHANGGTSYHLGRDDLRADAYSIRTARDKAGLTNAASAIDIGNFPRLVPFSRWLVAQARANAPGTSDMREIIYTPDNQRVLRWDRERGFDSQPREGEADDSHLFHTHISWYRDSERRAKVAPFRGFFADGDTMPLVKFTPGVDVAGIVTVTRDTAVIPIEGGDRPTVKAGIARPALGLFTLDDLADRPCYLMGVGAQLCFIAVADVTFKPNADCTDEVAAAVTATKASARVVFG